MRVQLLDNLPVSALDRLPARIGDMPITQKYHITVQMCTYMQGIRDGAVRHHVL